MKLITDGKYWAIQRGWVRKKYFDLCHPGYWWSSDCPFFRECWSDKETAQLWLKRLTL